MNVSRAPGVPCGSVFGRFLVLRSSIVGLQAKRAKMLEKPMKANDFSCFLCFSWFQYGAKLAQVGSNGLEVDRKLAQIGSKTAQERPRCGYAGQVFVSLWDSHSDFGVRPTTGGGE